jgi:flagella basal body P-ring formation protein FlgA
MEHAISRPGYLLAAAAALYACAAQAAESAVPAFEAQLRARRPDVVRWQTQAVETRTSSKNAEAAIVRVGRLGPRTAVRLADGGVRWYSVAGFAPVLVSVHSIDAGAALTAGDTAPAERDVIALGCEPLKEVDGGIRLRATRRIARGEIVCAAAVQIAPSVERDRPVILRTQRGPISASRVLTATNDANTGERVRLRDPASGATLVAVVTGLGAALDPNSEEQK